MKLPLSGISPRPVALALLPALLITAGSVRAGTEAAAEAPQSPAAAVNWATGENVSLGGFLFPHLHAFGAFGASSTEQSSLAVNGHDPQANATLQAIEPGISLRAGMLEGFATATGLTDAGGDFSFSLEEGFLKLVDLPLGLQLRGGQYFNRFGFQNSVHNHGWMFVDQNLVNGRFLNEGEMATIGGEVSWNVPLDFLQASVISASVGGLPSHSHGHDHAGHDHGAEAEFEAEGANFTDQLVTATWVNQYDIDDMNRLTGLMSGAWGDNEFGRRTQVYGLGFEYLWRENGYGAGGNSLRWRTELMIRDIEAVSGHLHGEEEEEHDEHGEEEHGHEDEHGEEEHEHEEAPSRRASFDEVGLYSMLVYGFNDRFETGLRADWVSGIDAMGLDDRVRLSPMITWYANQNRTLQARLQYNWDHSDAFGSESSIWFQIGLNWGGAEVR
ncbi:MAG: hypothetical protein JNK37_07605 [Verrucomicrobiales bacterium]|nr:hypothetical protein [Verrucomicrobiales bacterium]